MKHRTQVLLDPSQYDFLKSLSRREGESLGGLIRRFVDEKRRVFMDRRRKDPLEKMIGSFRDAECTSENYEDFIYGKKGS